MKVSREVVKLVNFITATRRTDKKEFNGKRYVKIETDSNTHQVKAVGYESEGNQAARSNCSSSHRCHRSAHRGSTWFLLSRCKDKHYFVNFQIFERFSSIFHHLSNIIHTHPNAPFHKIIKILWNYFCVFKYYLLSLQVHCSCRQCCGDELVAG